MPWQKGEQIKRIRAATEAATGELIPGMREQGKGIRMYCETDYAPLKACLVGNSSVMPAGTRKIVKDLEKRGWECYEVPYSTI